ncbi:uncharacterized protein LOC126330094 [Schistocerca gregaria]|uniref:uncharacterized protein LOC126330094 n=1 Tax=Schistocerca gregaria TaxID=7010 RepID=UPI00211DC01A|nr:uncharacterized protein LOC126330094 [Schistocerca gregaria]
MDMHLKLFFLEDCFKPNNGYSYLRNSLNSLLEHKTFSLKGKNEIQSVVAFINTKLNSHGDRVKGLHLLNVFLPQCSDDVFIDNCVSWMQQCVRICSSPREKEISLLVYEVLGNLFQYAGMIQELTKPVSGSVIPKFLEHVHHVSSNFHSQTENAAYLLRCLEFAVRNYGGSCGPHKSNIEQFLMKFIDNPDKQTVQLAARCVAVLPLVGGGGVLNVNHKNSWEVLQKKLVLFLQETLDELFEGVPEVQLFQSSERTGTEKLHIPVFEESDPFLRIQRLAMRFINLSCFLQELLVRELPVAKRVMPQLFVNLFVRGFGVNSNTISKHVTADKLIVGCLIPQMHIAMFKLLGALIMCCGQNLLEYGSLICKFVLQTLKWTSYDKHWPHGTERPYGLLRKEAYNTFTLWLKVAKAGSCVEISSPDELIGLLLGDVKISHTAVTLSAAKARGRHLTKQQRKQLKLGQESSASSSESSWSRTKLYDETANHGTCAAALRTLQWIVQSAGPFLKPTLHKMIQEELLKILLKIGRGEIFAPYSDWKCRLELYQLLHTLVFWPHCSWPPPLQFAIQLMRVGLSDPCVKVASFCSQSLNNFVKLVHPLSRPLHFTLSVDDMQAVIQLENSHKNRVIFSESMETDRSKLSPEQDSELLQVSSSPKHIHNASENHLHGRDTSTVHNNTDERIIKTKTVHDKNIFDLCSSDVPHSHHVTRCQDNDGSSDVPMDLVTHNNTTVQELQSIVTHTKYCDQNDSELETQNNCNIPLHLKLHDSEDELQDRYIETTEDSCISSLLAVAKNETKEKYETVKSNFLPEKHEVTRLGGKDEEENEEEEEEKDSDKNNVDKNQRGDQTGGGGGGGGGGGDNDDDDDDDDEDDYDDDGDDDDDDEMKNAFLMHGKESTVKKRVNFNISDKTAEKSIMHKAPISSNNYSISYLYDQSSDSNDSDIETDIVTCSVSPEINEVDKEELKEVNSLKNPHIAKTEADEHSQICTKNENCNENNIVNDEMQPVGTPPKLINAMNEEKQSSENHMDSTDNSNIANGVSQQKVLLNNLCEADESEVEVDVLTISNTEKEVVEHTHKKKVASVLGEGTLKDKNNASENEKENDNENEEVSFIEIAQVNETTTLPDEMNVSSEIPKEHDVSTEETSVMEVVKVKETTTLPEETKVPTEDHSDNVENSASEVQGDCCITVEVEDRFVAYSNNKKTELVDETDTANHGKDIQFERQCKTESHVEIPEEEIRLQDKNKGVGNEQIIKKQTSVSPNGQELMPETDWHQVQKEVDEVCMNSAAADSFTETEQIDAKNLTEPVTKKRKLESCVPEMENENNCHEQQKQVVV